MQRHVIMGAFRGSIRYRIHKQVLVNIIANSPLLENIFWKYSVLMILDDIGEGENFEGMGGGVHPTLVSGQEARGSLGPQGCAQELAQNHL
jgi:hypothetical protein